MSAADMTCMATVYFTPQKSYVRTQSSQCSTAPVAKWSWQCRMRNTGTTQHMLSFICSFCWCSYWTGNPIPFWGQTFDSYKASLTCTQHRKGTLLHYKQLCLECCQRDWAQFVNVKSFIHAEVSVLTDVWNVYIFVNMNGHLYCVKILQGSPPSQTVKALMMHSFRVNKSRIRLITFHRQYVPSKAPN